MKVPLKIFYHIYAVNHFMDIVEEQMRCMVDCGLYDEVEGIYVGLLGDKEALWKLQNFFNKYQKVKIESYGPDSNRCEFHTLKMLKEYCDYYTNKFYGFYIHTKGVSYTKPDFIVAGKFWRDYLMAWVITNWKQNYKALDLKFMGYDIAAPKIVPARVSPSKRTHASGNMWMFNSEYIKSLCKVESLNWADRFEAEMWAFSGQPIIYMPCNLFVDYLCQQPSYEEFVKNYKDLPDFCL